MMKFAIVLVALLGFANASLKDDVKEILALIPIDEIRAVTAEYAANDAEVKSVVNWIKTEGREILAECVAHESWEKFVVYCEDAGLDIRPVLAKISNWFTSSTFAIETDGQSTGTGATRSFHGWVNEIRALIPIGALRALVLDKMQTSSDFQDFYKVLSSEEATTFYAAIREIPAYQNLLQKGADHGLDIDSIRSALARLVGLSA